MAKTMQHRLGRLIAASVVALTIGACGGGASPLDQAVKTAADDNEFGTGPEAGASFARIAQFLNAAAHECDSTVDGTRCSAIAAASGYAQVLAVQVLPCTAPGRFEARTSMAKYLRAVDDVAPTDTAVPQPPPIPVCT